MAIGGNQGKTIGVGDFLVPEIDDQRNILVSFWKIDIWSFSELKCQHIFGDVKEDLSWLPTNIRSMYLYGLGGLSFLAEGFLLISIPFVWKRQSFLKLEKYIVMTTVFLLLFFIMAIMLDPKYRPL